MDKFSELKAAAMAATPGPWKRTITRFNGITNSTHSMASFSTEGVLANANEKRDAIFIAAANPAAVLALLAELEDERSSREQWQQNCTRAEERIAELEKRLELVREQRDSELRTSAILEKRLATPVRLPFHEFAHPLTERQEGYLSAIIDVKGYLREQGFTVEGGE